MTRGGHPLPRATASSRPAPCPRAPRLTRRARARRRRGRERAALDDDRNGHHRARNLAADQAGAVPCGEPLRRARTAPPPPRRTPVGRGERRRIRRVRGILRRDGRREHRDESRRERDDRPDDRQREDRGRAAPLGHPRTRCHARPTTPPPARRTVPALRSSATPARGVTRIRPPPPARSPEMRSPSRSRERGIRCIPCSRVPRGEAARHAHRFAHTADRPVLGGTAQPPGRPPRRTAGQPVAGRDAVSCGRPTLVHAPTRALTARPHRAGFRPQFERGQHTARAPGQGRADEGLVDARRQSCAGSVAAAMAAATDAVSPRPSARAASAAASVSRTCTAATCTAASDAASTGAIAAARRRTRPSRCRVRTRRP